MGRNLSIEFFARQFDRQIAERQYQLNPFEQWTLPHLAGRVLELGCGLGNLSIEAARAGHEVTAIDACPDAVKDLDRRAQAEGLPIRAVEADLAEWRATETYDTVVAIGLLMFFPCEAARAVLREIRLAVAPGGVAAVNVLIAGTTYMDMFDPDGHCLFPPHELEAAFADWKVLLSRIDDFPAPGETLKRFATVIARRR
jgi:tellurite methyltransferase